MAQICQKLNDHLQDMITHEIIHLRYRWPLRFKISVLFVVGDSDRTYRQMRFTIRAPNSWTIGSL